MWSAVSHDQGSVLFTHLRELGGQSFQEVNDLIRFAFGTLATSFCVIGVPVAMAAGVAGRPIPPR